VPNRKRDCPLIGWDYWSKKEASRGGRPKLGELHHFAYSKIPQAEPA
jgi:hypothetical protein